MTAVIGPDEPVDAGDAAEAAEGREEGPGGSIESAERMPAPPPLGAGAGTPDACTPASMLPAEPVLRADPSGSVSDGGCKPAEGSINPAPALRGVVPAAADVAEPAADADAAASRLERAGEAPPRVEGERVRENAPLLSDSAPTCGDRIATGAARERPAGPGDSGFAARLMTELLPLRGLRAALSGPPSAEA